MPSKSGRTFSVGETSASIEPTLKDTANTLIARMDQMDWRPQEFRDQADANCKDLATRLENLESNRKRITEENESWNNSRPLRRVWAQTYNTKDLSKT